ncbi:MAG: Arm DNA-binding domain-containing protein [Clostridia bacterium]|nr:Arm DNA-binding domain-containing protein [Clostridia bacterium]
MAYISKRGSTWHVRYYVGKDPVTGKKIQRSKGGFRTKKEAERFEREVEASLDNNTYIEPSKITVKEYLEKWLEEYSINLSPTTVAGYTRNIKNHTIPYIGHIPLQELQPIHIQSMYNTLHFKTTP